MIFIRGTIAETPCTYRERSILIAPGIKYLEKYGRYGKMFETKIIWRRGTDDGQIWPWMTYWKSNQARSDRCFFKWKGNRSSYFLLHIFVAVETFSKHYLLVSFMQAVLKVCSFKWHAADIRTWCTLRGDCSDLYIIVALKRSDFVCKEGVICVHVCVCVCVCVKQKLCV